ncbi:MAG TPA: DUF2141 domain-containing protein [Bryobacteraceae bacterium]|nr:DUF2141 domain-containing protein [Bryobacteraceae bacterium]
MRILILAAAAGVLPLAGWAFAGSGSATFTLTVDAEGVSNSKGVVGVLVFNSPKGWPEDVPSALKGRAVPAHAGATEIVIPDLPEGDYGVVVLHDLNQNKKLDRNWLGAPKEQWGMSNNPRYFLSAPSYNDARFDLAKDQTIRVRLN